MAPWLQVVSLLVLLVVSSPWANASPTQHLCGFHLVEALYLVCGDKGFSFNPKTEKDLEPLRGFQSPGQESQAEKFHYKGQGELKMKRGVVEQCCLKPCNIFDLQFLCN